MLATVKKGVAKLVPESSRRDKRHPVTLEHMHCLLHGLDLSNAKDAAVYGASSVAFHGLCRSAIRLSLTDFRLVLMLLYKDLRNCQFRVAISSTLCVTSLMRLISSMVPLF
jgi:hypothetical protein